MKGRDGASEASIWGKRKKEKKKPAVKFDKF